jgi:DNA (cytosine-5)-methyltransferase 3A
MNVLSLFDGISGTQQALNNLGLNVDNYFASEIDKYAIQITQKNFPNTIQLGNVLDVSGFNLPHIDLMVWGSPCQDLSIAKKDRKGLDGKRSGLFWEAVRIWKEVKPKYWLMENVASMPKEAKEIISKELGVEPILINSALVSGQNRKRLYWTNIPNIKQPEDQNIFLKDVLEVLDCEKLKSYAVRAGGKGSGVGDKHNLDCYKVFNKPKRIGQIGNGGQGERIYSTKGKSPSLNCANPDGAKAGLYPVKIGSLNKGQSGDVYSTEGKSSCLMAGGGGGGAKTGLYCIDDFIIRKLTPIECERLQTFSDNYTQGISNTQRYKCLGNSFTVKVIEHILRNIF